MAPVAVDPVDSHQPLNGKHEANGGTAKSEYRQPLRKVGTLDANFKFEEVTPVIGREYPTANIVDDLLNAQKADELLRDLAITSKSSLEFITARSTLDLIMIKMLTNCLCSLGAWCCVLPCTR